MNVGNPCCDRCGAPSPHRLEPLRIGSADSRICRDCAASCQQWFAAPMAVNRLEDEALASRVAFAYADPADQEIWQ